jgi:hypothetical protein
MTIVLARTVTLPGQSASPGRLAERPQDLFNHSALFHGKTLDYAR